MSDTSHNGTPTVAQAFDDALGIPRLPAENVRDQYGTPDWLFDPLHAEFRFEIDAAASFENKKCPLFYTRENNAFENPWDKPTFCNPPFSKAGGGIINWVRYGKLQSEIYNVPVVMLAPGDTSSAHWQFALHFGAEIRTLTRRVNFVGGNGRPDRTTVIYVFRNMCARMQGHANISVWDYKP